MSVAEEGETMAIFLTEFRDHHGRVWYGPRIQARSVEEARNFLRSLKETMRITGVLVETIEFETGKRTLYPPPEEGQ